MPRGERIVLLIAAAPSAAAGASPGWTLNGLPLEALPSARRLSPRVAGAPTIAVDVTQALAPRNELFLCGAPVVEGDDAAGRRVPLPESVARVWLEVHEAGAAGLA